MRLYIAAPWVRRDDARQAMNALHLAGHDITAHWITRSVETDDLPTLRREAIEDLQDIERAEGFVILNLDKSEGKATELGFVLGWNRVANAHTDMWWMETEKPIYLVGLRTRNLFYHLPCIQQFDTLDRLIDEIALPRPKH